MLVFPEKKALVVKAREPDQLLTLIPTAKKLGPNLVAIPHRMDEARVLTNMGLAPPSPIRYFYDWPGKYKPFKAQLDTSEFLTLHPRSYLLNEMGTGKTMAVLWAFDFLRKAGVLKRMIVVCPLSTMERTWADEVFQHFPDLTYTVLFGTRDRRKALLKEEADVYIVNHDGLKIIQDELADRPDIDLVVPDEIAQAARNASTDRWKCLNEVVNKQIGGRRWCWGVTGTPTPNDPTDAWAQCRLVTPSSVPPYYGRFRDQVMRQVNNFLWVPRPDATDTVHKAMQPSIRFTRDECMDLPECLFQTRHVPLTAEQATAYKSMLSKLKFEVEAGEVLAVNEAVKTSKLVQICCGAAYDGEREEIRLDAKGRIDAVEEIINEAEGKVIVFVPFIASVNFVADELEKRMAGRAEVAKIYGEVPPHQRNQIFSDFQAPRSKLRILVAQPAAMSHGLTLTESNTIVWYAPIFSNDIYDQACARITRAGQKRQQFIINIEGSPVEQRMYERLKKKQKMQGLLLSMVEDSRIETVA